MKASDDMTDTIQYVFAKFLYETLVNIFLQFGCKPRQSANGEPR